jgi:hypothetical protein
MNPSRMTPATYQGWRQRIWFATDRDALTTLHAELCALPASRERAILIQMWGHRWSHILPDHPRPSAPPSNR